MRETINMCLKEKRIKDNVKALRENMNYFWVKSWNSSCSLLLKDLQEFTPWRIKEKDFPRRENSMNKGRGV